MDYIIIGLGNPGRRYENTKHNMGFLALDLLAERNGIKINKLKHRALCGEGAIAGLGVLLVKPQTYMNLSGESVRAVMDYYRATRDRLLVIYDDIDIPIGDIRIRKKGSAGSHNGMRSIVRNLGYEDFPRIRIGIRDGQRAQGDSLIGYVLGGFRKQRIAAAEDAIGRAAEAAECLLRDGADAAMNRYNARVSERDGGAGANCEKDGADEER
ncbi:MAG: aminoacyl-tRNA hydrolase [Clostridiales Family XIII bacterium]|jgi:PTH1 family peptidyl-tRNA hydrolase|nr:aminoacyl-tRNA hydrolase [Clostridiales Family XIII bacterium]